jgi:hypothetical protein
MRRLTTYLGLAFAACLACFSMTAMAEPLRTFAHYMVAMDEPQGVSMKRLELTLAQWRTGSEGDDKALSANLRASSNHFVMTSTKPEATGVGAGIGIDEVRMDC